MNQTITHAFVVLFFFCINHSLHAQTWNGSISSDWDVAGNWSPAEVPSDESHVIIPGTGVTNWPVLNNGVSLGSLQLRSGSQIDVKGHFIYSEGNVGSYSFLLEGSTINNSEPSTEIVIGTFSGGNVLMENCTFNGNTHITLTGVIYSLFRADELQIKSNHFIGNTKITESYQVGIAIGNSINPENNAVLYGGLLFDGDFEFERKSSGSSNVFRPGGATVNGNFRYKNLAGTAYRDLMGFEFDRAANIGATSSIPYAKTTISGNLDIIVNGSLILGDNISYSGVGKITFVGGKNGYLRYNGTNSFILPNVSMEKTAAATITLDQPVSIAGQLSFTGGYITSSAANLLSFLPGATTSGASNASHVVGPVKKIGNEVFTFPTGSGSKLFPVTISAPALATDAYSAQYFSSNPTSSGYSTNSKAASIFKVFDAGFWDVKRLAGTSNVSVSLGYDFPAGYITDPSKLRVAHWNGSVWEDLGNGAIGGSVTVGDVATASAVTNFSPFTIATADASNPLPVRLIAFSAKKENETVLLEWSTTEEENSDRFEIQHSINATNWTTLGEVKSTGLYNSLSDYDYVHTRPSQGINYYRLKMIDTDETYAFSRIVNAKISSESRIVFYPNPAHERLFVETPTGTVVQKLEMSNGLGKVTAILKNAEISNGVSLTGLSSGVYFVSIVLSNGQKETHKIFVAR